mmetsp:Transcript_161134/g.517151  ORF Transcript_161134/g.517151 Transcript_161134/m.517151 type:complete len:293 (+) Transcript_161134:143-1021(+)
MRLCSRAFAPGSPDTRGAKEGRGDMLWEAECRECQHRRNYPRETTSLQLTCRWCARHGAQSHVRCRSTRQDGCESRRTVNVAARINELLPRTDIQHFHTCNQKSHRLHVFKDRGRTIGVECHCPWRTEPQESRALGLLPTHVGQIAQRSADKRQTLKRQYLWKGFTKCVEAPQAGRKPPENTAAKASVRCTGRICGEGPGVKARTRELHGPNPHVRSHTPGTTLRDIPSAPHEARRAPTRFDAQCQATARTSAGFTASMEHVSFKPIDLSTVQECCVSEHASRSEFTVFDVM